MSSSASRKYSAVMTALKEDNPEAHRVILSRVQSWKTIADKWRRQAQGKPETPNAKHWRQKAEHLQHTVTRLEAQINALGKERA